MIKRINCSNRKSKHLKDEHVRRDTKNLMIYYVTSQTVEIIIIKCIFLKKNIVQSPLCILRFSECNFCIYTHIYTCLDSAIYLNLCKHIHKVGSMNPANKVIDDEENIQEDIGEIEIQQTKQFLDI